MSCSESLSIASGDSVDVSIDWGEVGQLFGVPVATWYQVFDYATGAAVSPSIAVLPALPEVEFVVDGKYLTNTAKGRRRLRVQVSSQFAIDRKTVFLDIWVEHTYPSARPVAPGQESDESADVFGLGHIAADGVFV